MRKTVLTSVLTTCAVLIGERLALACAVCFGDPSSPESRGLTLAIFGLLVVTVGVLGCFAAFFASVLKRARKCQLEGWPTTAAVAPSRSEREPVA
jgi:hypothetical protein